jgi:hypothetical protein
VIAQVRKRALMNEVVQFASEVLERTADSCESAAPSAASDEEDDFAREYLRGVAGGLRKQRGGAS